MESAELDVKPDIQAEDIRDKSLFAVPGVCKLKQSRYEDVWPDDVHAAFMEAVALYPPMGKRRLKYYRVSAHENEHSSDTNQARSFGRCQLIQSYILEKTGKNRSRKQVSSHLQRLKKIHKDNPAMLFLFSDRSQPPLEHRPAAPPTIATEFSQDISTHTSAGTRHFKRDADLTVDLQNTETSTVDYSTFHCPSEAPSLNGSSCSAHELSTVFHDQPSFSQKFLSPVPQQCPLGSLHSSNSDYLSELQGALLFKDAVNEGFRSGPAFSASTFSLSMHRLASRFPVQASGPTMHFSRAVDSPVSPGSQPSYRWTYYDGLMEGVSCNPLLSSAEETFPTSFLPLQTIPLEKRVDSCLGSAWVLPKNPDVLLDPREGSFGEIHLRCPPAMYPYNAICPEITANTPGSYNCLSENEAPPFFPGGISLSCAVTSAATVTEGVSNEGTIDLPKQSSESSENLASPLVISPIPVYPISYIHPEVHSSTPFHYRALDPGLPP